MQMGSGGALNVPAATTATATAAAAEAAAAAAAAAVAETATRAASAAGSLLGGPGNSSRFQAIAIVAAGCETCGGNGRVGDLLAGTPGRIPPAPHRKA